MSKLVFALAALVVAFGPTDAYYTNVRTGCTSKDHFRPHRFPSDVPCVEAVDSTREGADVDFPVQCRSDDNYVTSEPHRYGAVSVVNKAGDLKCFSNTIYLKDGEAIRGVEDFVSTPAGWFTHQILISEDPLHRYQVESGLIQLTNGVGCDSDVANHNSYGQEYVVKTTMAYRKTAGVALANLDLDYLQVYEQRIRVVCRGAQNDHNTVYWHYTIPQTFYDYQNFPLVTAAPGTPASVVTATASTVAINPVATNPAFKAPNPAFNFANGTVPVDTELVVDIGKPEDDADIHTIFLAFQKEWGLNPTISCGPTHGADDGVLSYHGTGLPLFNMWAGAPGLWSRQRCIITFANNRDPQGFNGMVHTAFETFGYDGDGNQVEFPTIIGSAQTPSEDWAKVMPGDSNDHKKYLIHTCGCKGHMPDGEMASRHAFTPLQMGDFTRICGQKNAKGLCSPRGTYRKPTYMDGLYLIRASYNDNFRCFCKQDATKPNNAGKTTARFKMPERHVILGQSHRYTVDDAYLSTLYAVAEKGGRVQRDHVVPFTLTENADKSDGWETEVQLSEKNRYGLALTGSMDGFFLASSVSSSLITAVDVNEHFAVKTAHHIRGFIDTWNVNSKWDDPTTVGLVGLIVACIMFVLLIISEVRNLRGMQGGSYTSVPNGGAVKGFAA